MAMATKCLSVSIVAKPIDDLALVELVECPLAA